MSAGKLDENPSNLEDVGVDVVVEDDFVVEDEVVEVDDDVEVDEVDDDVEVDEVDDDVEVDDVVVDVEVDEVDNDVEVDEVDDDVEVDDVVVDVTAKAANGLLPPDFKTNPIGKITAQVMPPNSNNKNRTKIIIRSLDHHDVFATKRTGSSYSISL